MTHYISLYIYIYTLHFNAQLSLFPTRSDWKSSLPLPGDAVLVVNEPNVQRAQVLRCNLLKTGTALASALRTDARADQG